MRICNTHDQLHAAGGGVAITRQAGSGWCIYRLDEKGSAVPTDPEGPWYNGGMKTFLSIGAGPMKARRDAALAKAIAWVAKTYGETGPWVGNRLGDKVPERIAKAYPIRRP